LFCRGIIQALDPNGASVTVAGATGFKKDSINGTYVKLTELQNDKPVYVKVGDKNECLFYGTNAKWLFSTVSNKDKNETFARAYSTTTKLASPELETAAWRVSEKDAGGKTSFQDQIAVTFKAEVRRMTFGS